MGASEGVTLVSFDIDGTLETGDPPGPLTRPSSGMFKTWLHHRKLFGPDPPGAVKHVDRV